MRISINKTKLTAITTMILLMSSVFVFITGSTVRAQTAGDRPISGPLPAGVTVDDTAITRPYLSERPDPVGLNQRFLVNLWVTPATNAHRFMPDYKVTITKPSGEQHVVTMDSYQADATAWFEWIADEMGTWTINFEHAGTYFQEGWWFQGLVYDDEADVPSAPPGVYRSRQEEPVYLGSAYYTPSSTDVLEFVVQEDPVLSWPPSPLPTDYWTRPVQVEHREWTEILGNFPWRGPGGGPNWPADTNIYSSDDYDFIPYVQGPESAHIVWKRQEAISGMIGAGQGINSLVTTPGYLAVIYEGRGYKVLTKVVNGATTTVWQCFDIRTGEVYWEVSPSPIPAARLSFGGWSNEQTIEYSYRELSVPGEAPKTSLPQILHIGNGRLLKLDPWSGAVTLNVSIAPLSSGDNYMNGYALSVQNLGGGNYRLINWTTLGTDSNFADRVVSNITWPWSNLGNSVDYQAGIAARTSAVSPEGLGAWYGIIVRAADLNTGEELWSVTVEDEPYFSSSCTVADQGKVAVTLRDGYLWAWDLRTGNLEWKSEQANVPWGIWWTYDIGSAYGMIYGNAYDGLYAFDWDDGTIAWIYQHETPYDYETPYCGCYSMRGTSLIADGKVYTYDSEHTPSQPITRGWKLHCVDAYSGVGIWSVTTPGDPHAVADGYLAVRATDGFQYIFGKGLSETTVTAPDVAVPKGTAFTIKGTVLDLSPAQPGTPCVSTDSMGTQMEYLHRQMPIGGVQGDKIITGVPVTLTAIDNDGNYVDIGITT
ncbi:PQQ-binding-like beta-propeller repeat protein, partial [Thermoproteota archaeon]